MSVSFGPVSNLVSSLWCIAFLCAAERLGSEAAETCWNQLSQALRLLHAHGYAHMDVKPANICISVEGDFVLIDLGSVASMLRD